MKNPWMSMWLSAANASAGAARGFWTAEMRRQQNAMLKELTGQTTRSSKSSTGSAKKRSPAKRRSKTTR
jgi:hypothetical protein